MGLTRLSGSVCLAMLIGAIALISVGCGSSDSNGSSAGSAGSEKESPGVAEARAEIEEFSAVPKFTFEAEPFDMSQVEGKTIFSVSFSSANLYSTLKAKSTTAVAEEYGAKWVEYTNQGTPSEWAAGIEQGVNRRADLIVVGEGIDPSLLREPLERAKAAGIPVLYADPLPNGSPRSLVTAYLGNPHARKGKLMADYVIADSTGQANALIIAANEAPSTKPILDAMANEFSTKCPDCKSKVVNVPGTQWVTGIPSEVRSALQGDPTIDYVVPVYDSMATLAMQGVTQAGKSGAVKMVTGNGSADALKLLQDEETMAMVVGLGIDWVAYATMDQAGRILVDGVSPIANGDEGLPTRVFTKDNVNETGTPPEVDRGYGDAYVKGYTELWSGGR